MIMLLIGTFIQPTIAVGVSMKCIDNNIAFNCAINVFIIIGLKSVIIDALWRRNHSIVLNDSNPYHNLLQTCYELKLEVIDLEVHNITMDDDGVVYACNVDGAPDFTINITGMHNYLVCIA